MEKGTQKIIIAALSDNGVIGMDNRIPWDIPEDRKRFRSLTLGYPVIMGRNTFESIYKSLGKPLDRRLNLVLTSSPEYLYERFNYENVVFCGSLKDAFNAAKVGQMYSSDRKAFIIGGRQVYEQTLDLADRMELTWVHEIVRGDAFFPETDYSKWKETAREDFPGFSFAGYGKREI